MLHRDQFLQAEAVLDGQTAEADSQVLRFLAFLGLVPGAGGPAGRLLRLAARMDRVFATRPPDAPGAALFGATRVLRGDQGFAGAPGAQVEASYAGVGLTPLAAFSRCMGEAAEHAAMFALSDDPRGDRAVALRRLDGAGGARTSTGHAAGASLDHATDSAICERVERHAIARWFTGAAAASLPPPPEARLLEAGFRGPKARHLGYLVLPADVAGFVVVAAVTTGETGMAVGYGCATDAAQAACKALSEVVQGEFALRLERARAADGIAPPATGFVARAGLFAQMPGLLRAAAPLPVLPPAGRRARDLIAAEVTDLTVPGTDVPVVHAAIPGLRDIASMIAPGTVGPL